MRRFLAFSLLLHACFGALFLFRSRRPSAPTPEAVIVELPEAPASPGISVRGTGSGGRTSARPHLSLSPTTGPNLVAARPGETTLRGPNTFGASDGDVFAPGVETSALGWVYRQTQGSLGYPAEFVRHEIEGRVEADLAFSEAGAFLPELLTVRAESPYLRVYVHRLIEHVFAANPVPETFRHWNGNLKVYCFLNFTGADGRAEVVARTTPILGHKLFFTRASNRSAADKLKWNLGPVHGFGPVPAVAVDVLWFAQKAKEAVHPQAPVDDLAPWRADPLFYN